MTRKEEDYLFETIEHIRAETHENNIMLKQIIIVIRTWIKHHPQENENDFNMNIIANLISNIFDIKK